jgi:acetoin utilization deacetylase AcuC-like enzyme
VVILVSQGVDRQRKKGLGEVEITMSRYKRWSERKYNKTQRMMVIIFGGIEEDPGRPVFTANQVVFWYAVRQAGVHAPVKGYGRLFSELNA